MLKFRSGNFVDEFESIEMDKQRQFGECLNFVLQQTRRYTNLFLNEGNQSMTPFMDSQSERTKSTNNNKVYIIQQTEAKELFKTLGRKRREAKKLKDDNKDGNRREIGKLQRETLDIERQLFQHFMGVLHCLCEDYFVQLSDKNEEMSELREICEDLQRKADLYAMDPINQSLAPTNASTLENESFSKGSTTRKTSSASKSKIDDLKLEIEELYDEMSNRERIMNRISNLLQQISVLMPVIPKEPFPLTILNQNKNLVTESSTLELNDFDLESFIELLLTTSDYIYHTWNQKSQPSTRPATPVKNALRQRAYTATSSSTESSNHNDALEDFFSKEPQSNQQSSLVNENKQLKSKIAQLEEHQSDLNTSGLFQLQEDLDTANTENTYLQQRIKQLESEKDEFKVVKQQFHELRNNSASSEDQSALINELQSQIESLKVEKQTCIEDADRRVNTLNKKLTDDLQTAQTTFVQDLKDKQSVIDQLHDQLNVLEQTQSQHDFSINEAHTVHEKEVNSMQNDLSQFKEEMTRLNEEKSTLISTLRLRQFGNLLLKNYYKSKADNSILEIEFLKEEKEGLEQFLKEAQTELTLLHNRHKDSEIQLKDALDKQSELKHSQKDVDTAIDDLKAENIKLKNKNAELQGNKEGLLQAKSDAQDRLFEVQAQMSSVKNKYDELTTKIASFEKDIENKNNKISLLEHDIEELSAGNDVGEKALKQVRELTMENKNLKSIEQDQILREIRLNNDIDGIYLEFTRINETMINSEEEKQRLQQELKTVMKELNDAQIKYDEMRLNMVSEGMDNQMLRSMIDGLKESYLEELNEKFKHQDKLLLKIKEMEQLAKNHLYNSHGKSTQT